jgi:hypothetical protein
MAHWRNVAKCMRRHGVSGFPDPTTSVPRILPFIGELSDRDGAILAIPAGIDQQSRAFMQAATACGFISNEPAAQGERVLAADRTERHRYSQHE